MAIENGYLNDAVAVMAPLEPSERIQLDWETSPLFLRKSREKKEAKGG